MTTRSSAIPRPQGWPKPDTPGGIQERRQRLMDHFEKSHIPFEERTWICLHRQIVRWEDNANNPTECNADHPRCSSARGEFLGMMKSIADMEGCDGKWICFKCKAKKEHAQITVNEPWMRHCKKYITIYQTDQCGGTFCPGTRTGGAWYWKCKGICSVKQWNDDGTDGGNVSRSDYNSPSQVKCPFFDGGGIKGGKACGVSLDGGFSAVDKVALMLLNTHAEYLEREPWSFFCLCPQQEWTPKSSRAWCECQSYHHDAESKAREDGTLWKFYFK